MNSRPLLIFTGLLLLAITILGSTYLVTRTVKQIKFGQGTLHVKGCAEKSIQSDFAKWQGTISTSGQTQIAAYEKMEHDLDVLRKQLNEEGIPSTLIELSPISTSVIYQRNPQGYSTNVIDRYELSLSFSVSTADIPLITKVSQNITTLLKQGLSIQSSPPQYFYMKIEELKISMLGEAAKDARLRAEELVSKSSGSKIGPLRSAQQGVFQITPAFSTSISDYGEFDTSSIAKRIKAVVTMEYAID